MKKIWKNIFILFSFVLMFVFLLSHNLNQYVSNLDELWNYNTASIILKGLTPYSQISMITTPLLPLLNSLVMGVTANSLIILRVANAVLSTLILVISYRILNKLTKKTLINILFTIGLALVLHQYFALDYNFLALFLFLCIEYLEITKLQNKENRIFNKYDLIIGLLAGISICTKQTIGIIISAYVLIIEAIRIYKYKQYWHSILWRLIGIAIPTITLLAYLLITGTFADFIDYAIIGIKTFNNTVLYSKLFENENLIVSNLALLIPLVLAISTIFLITYKIKKINNSVIDKIGVLTISSFPMLIVIYPISDAVHFLIGSLPAVILILYLLTIAGEKAYNILSTNNKRFVITAIYTFAGLYFLVQLLVGTGTNILEYEDKLSSNVTLEHYEYIPVPTNFAQRMEILKEYFEEKKKEGYDVIIADAEACVYTIPMNIYHKNFDMFLKGNIGKDGEDGIISDINNSQKTIYLIKQQDQPLNWQTPKKVIEYIRENLEMNGKIDIFDIYIKE